MPSLGVYSPCPQTIKDRPLESVITYIKTNWSAVLTDVSPAIFVATVFSFSEKLKILKLSLVKKMPGSLAPRKPNEFNFRKKQATNGGGNEVKNIRIRVDVVYG